MKRYFDIPQSRLTLQLDVTSEGMKHTVGELEEMLKLNGLREIDKQEWKKLSDEYTKK
jgi:hypothetical protein